MVRKKLEIKILGERHFINNKNLVGLKENFSLGILNFPEIIQYTPYVVMSYYDILLKNIYFDKEALTILKHFL